MKSKNLNKMVTEESIIYSLKQLGNLVFETTDSCNLNCKYCAYSTLYEGYDKREGKMLSFEKANLIIDYIFSIRNSTPGIKFPLIIGFYGGEPLLNFSFIKKVVEYIKTINCKNGEIIYSMTTNGLLLDKHIDFLVTNDFFISVSLDGDEYAQSYRVDPNGKNSHGRVIKNLYSIKENYPNFLRDKVNFLSVIHNRNEVEKTYNYINELFDKKPRFLSLSRQGIKQEKMNEFKQMYNHAYQSIKRSNNCEELENKLFLKSPLTSDLAKHIFRKSGNVYTEYKDLILNPKSTFKRYTSTCYPFSRKMFITVNGKILPCEQIPQEYGFGQVHDDRVELDFEKIANLQNNYISKISKGCDKCLLFDECPICIYQVDKLHLDSGVCAEFCNQQMYDKRVDELMQHLRLHPDYYSKILKQVNFK